MPQHSESAEQPGGGDAHLLDVLRRRQRELERLYQLEAGPDVCHFVRIDAAHHRETVLVRHDHEHDELEIAVLLPAGLKLPQAQLNDAHLQIIEGVSHFVLLSERARTELPATRLELEIQAEVDKFVLLVVLTGAAGTRDLRRLHHWLFDRVAFLHDANTEDGERYRTANDVAARLCSKLAPERDPKAARSLLRRFYRSGQAEKIRLALAA